MWPAALLLITTLQSVRANSYRLPGNVWPAHYDLRIIYDIDPNTNFSFFGIVDILITAREPTLKIVLHGKDLTIDDNGILLSGQPSTPRAVTAEFDDNYDFLVIYLDNELQQNVDYTLTISFYGNAAKGLDGAYISSYMDKDTGIEEYLISTQFEAIAARKAFPCFDEPMYKAIFSITIGHYREFTAISNMPLKSRVDNNVLLPHWPWKIIQKKFKKYLSEFIWDKFDKSVPTSTYLVAFMVSKFSFVDSPAGLSTTKIRTWASKDVIHQASYVADVSPRILSYFEEFFAIPFPIPKLDLVANPGMLSNGMENWGLIIMNEKNLLFDKQQSTLADKKGIVSLIGPEIAHQWFGNLVTMKWWTDLWLNEGFATYFGMLALDAIEPSWDSERTNVGNTIKNVLILDALESSHPISVQVDNPSHIGKIFDSISYGKASSIIRMMKMFLGDGFRRGLHNYLVKYSYKNAEQDDLWRELTDASKANSKQSLNVSVKQVMDSWTTQTGFPILTVTRDYTDSSLSISQRRYLTRSVGSGSSSWWVPLRVLCEPDILNPREAIMWLADNEGVTSLHRFEHYSNPDQWVIFNYDMIAPYRVNYDNRNWKLISDALNSDRYSAVPVLGRVQLLSDALELAWSNQLDYSTALQLTSYLRHEKEFLPLDIGHDGLQLIGAILKFSPHYGAYQKFGRWLIADTYKTTGGLATKKILDADNPNRVKLQVLTSKWACDMMVPDCETNAIQMFRQWMNSKDPDKENPIPPDLREIVFKVAIRRGSEEHWRFLFDFLQNTKEKKIYNYIILKSLACSQEVWLLNQYLEMLYGQTSHFDMNEKYIAITGLMESSVGYYTARDFIYKRFADIYKSVFGLPKVIEELIKALVGQFTTQQDLHEFLAWRQRNIKYFSESSMWMKQALEKAAINIEWVSRHQKAVVDKLLELTETTTKQEVRKILRDGGNAQMPVTRVLCITVIITSILPITL